LETDQLMQINRSSWLYSISYIQGSFHVLSCVEKQLFPNLDATTLKGWLMRKVLTWLLWMSQVGLVSTQKEFV